jgi:glucose dehydrogenase
MILKKPAMVKEWVYSGAVSALLLLQGCGPTSSPVESRPVTSVTAQRVANANAEPGNWLSHGRTYFEQRFSPLDQINTGNIEQLKLSWFFDFDDYNVVEATPLVVDGRMYVTAAKGKLYAMDAATGEELWRYDPKVPPEALLAACCQPVNRGAAVWGDKVYVGTLDGRLIAVDALSGKLVWEQLTVDPNQAFTITGAPRVIKGKVIIGNAGAEYGVRGNVSAYDAETGEMA